MFYYLFYPVDLIIVPYTAKPTTTNCSKETHCFSTVLND